MKYLDQWTQQDWDTFNQGLADIFGVEYTPTPYEPIMMDNAKRCHAAQPWNKGKQGLQPSTRKGTKQGPMSDEQKLKISQGMKRAGNSMHNPIHKAIHKAAMAKRNTPEWREKLRQAALARWSKQKA
jgi:hypothetical protein